MATSTLCQSSPLGSPSGSPRSCLYRPHHPSFQPKADWRASFTDSNRENREASPYRPILGTKPLILRQHNGVWLPRLRETFSLDMAAKPQPQSSKEKAAEDTETSPSKSRLSLGRMAKVLRCHVCLSTVKEQHFHNHLFFGAVRCELCFTICQDCRVYEWLCEEAEVEYSKCQHKFAYCEDPYEYLLPRLCGSDDCDLVGSATLPHNLRVLQNYVNKLASLQLREPWSSALRKCKTHLLKACMTSPSKPSEDVSFQDQEDALPMGSTMEDTQGNKTAHKKSEELSSSIRAALGKPTCSSPALRDSWKNDDSDDGLLLTQSYDLEHLEQEVEYVELEEHSRTLPERGFVDKPNHLSKPKKRRKINHYKKTHRLTPHPKKRAPPYVEQGQEEEEEEEDLVMEQVDLPEDGYYLMVREAVEECPMCYEPLCPSMCTVNIRTFLFTVRCPECSLIIYMVPDLPDGLQIVTEDTSSGMVTAPTKSAKPKTKIRKVYPKDFIAC